MAWIDKTAYQILEHLSKISTYSSHQKYSEIWTPRLQAIRDILDDCGIPFEVENFKVDRFVKDNTFTNIYASFRGTGEDGPGLLFLAHHDIANPRSQNCQDNTASVSHLIKMMMYFHENPPVRDVHIALVDTEEHVNPYSCGNQILAAAVNDNRFGDIAMSINLELTGLGRNIWVSSFERCRDSAIPFIEALGANPVNTPYNDAAVMNAHGVASMCIGILPDSEWNAIRTNRSYPRTWALCHQIDDDISKINSDDMDEFTNKLIEISTS